MAKAKAKEKEVVEEVEKKEQKESKLTLKPMPVLPDYGKFITELRSSDSLSHEQIEQLIAKYGI